ncbi:MAG: SAM-dependent methyltransferase, partial [Gemmataceae bacterium]|nr:SAM-dependent methyltransferase [Gemmataceae bacterium]
MKSVSLAARYHNRMGMADLDRESLHRLVTDTVLGAGFRRATFGGTQRGAQPTPWVRVVVRPVRLRDGEYCQFSYFDARKNVTKNARGREVGERLREVIAAGYAGIHLATGADEIDIRTTKRGKFLVGRRKVDDAPPEPSPAHNHVKDVPLPEGQADRLLDALGILTRDGRVRPAMRAKYTQINEFLKHLSHVLDDAGLRSLGRAVEILDCGCGASYLTLAAHHYLNDVLGIPARVTGVDVNDELIRKSAGRADHLGADGVAFACGPIGDTAGRPDIVVALHACDTATDDAIARAVSGEARLLLSVPCCHHDLRAYPKTAVDATTSFVETGRLRHVEMVFFGSFTDEAGRGRDR